MKQMLSEAIMLLVALCAEAQDLTVTIPKIDSTAYKCYPVKANTGFSLQSLIKCNANGPFRVKIDRDLSFGSLGRFITLMTMASPLCPYRPLP